MNEPDRTMLQPPSSHSRIAIVEDNVELREAILAPGLREHGFSVVGVSTAAELYRTMVSHQFDAVVLDIGLPGEDGLSVSRHLREVSNIGIVILTGQRGTRHHIDALHSGADVFLTKPVDIELLAVTLQGLNRRLSAVSEQAADYAVTRAWTLEASGWRLVSPSGKALPLSAPEHCVVERLASDCGQTVARAELINALTNNVHDFDPHRIDMLIHRLRRKAQKLENAPFTLLTVRGQGYVLTCDVAAGNR
jgi:DNA-binding response OmpR family regulator